MITIYDSHASGLARRDGLVTPEAGTVWIDLYNPTREEELHIEGVLGIELPTREEMKEIEASSRLYQEDGAQFMTATLVTQIDDPWPVTSHVTFVLVKDKLVTIRYCEPYAFYMLTKRAMASPADATVSCGRPATCAGN